MVRKLPHRFLIPLCISSVILRYHQTDGNPTHPSTTHPTTNCTITSSVWHATSIWMPTSSTYTLQNHSLSFQQHPSTQMQQQNWPQPNTSTYLPHNQNHIPYPSQSHHATMTYTSSSPYIPTTYPYFPQASPSTHPPWSHP
jgi:hypothetical protein